MNESTEFGKIEMPFKALICNPQYHEECFVCWWSTPGWLVGKLLNESSKHIYLVWKPLTLC